jgi:hypothetical protein
MTLYARNEHDPVEIGDMVIELFTPLEGFTIDGCFHPAVRRFFHEVPAGTLVNSIWSGTTWIPPEAI